MNLEEKRKEIERLCNNLDEKFRVNITQKVTIKNSIAEYKNTVRVDTDVLYGVFNIDKDEQYNDLIDMLKKNQKQPELYTLEEIKSFANVGYFKTIQSHKLFLDLIKKHAKPYKKQS